MKTQKIVTGFRLKCFNSEFSSFHFTYFRVLLFFRLSLNSSDCPLKPDFDALEQILPTTFNFLDEIWFFGVGTAIIGTTKFFGQDKFAGNIFHFLGLL